MWVLATVRRGGSVMVRLGFDDSEARWIDDGKVGFGDGEVRWIGDCKIGFW